VVELFNYLVLLFLQIGGPPQSYRSVALPQIAGRASA
jgi:hypothetical protein